jgi:F-type H+-transporting ATPase subunit delta
VTGRAAASRYAKALFDVVHQEGQSTVEAVGKQLQDFADFLAGNDALAGVLGNPGIPAVKKHAVAQALLDRAGLMAAPLSKLILMLADRDRLMLLPEIARAFRDHVMDHQKIMRGEVTTAVPLAPDTVRKLEQGLGQASGRTVMLDARVDPSIIGGVITRLGSTVYDGSVATQLQKMKQALTEGAQ